MQPSSHVYAAGKAFYRAESSQARDLAVLAAAVYKQAAGQLRVLDAACGCGGRALRYLAQVRSLSAQHRVLYPAANAVIH